MATEVKLKLALEGARVVSQEIDGVTHSVGNMRSASISANTSLAELGSQAIALTKTMAGLSAIQKGVTAAGDYAGLASRMKLLTGSAEAAAIAMQSVQDIAMRQGASLAAVGDSYAKIGQAMLTMGGTSADTARMVETVAAALRLGNASTQEAASAMRQFGQAMAKGKLNGDEFVSLMENAPYLMDAVAASLGKTKGDLFAMAEAGKLTSQVFGDAVLGSFDSVTGKAATLAPTIGQAMERITTSFTVAAAASSNVGMVSSAAFAAMGFAADHAAQILGMLTTGAIVGLTNQVMRATSAVAAKVTATLADRAAMVASLQATVASTEARAIYTGIVLREAQATLASTAGMAASVRAQTAVVAATAAHTAATVAQTEAQLALNTATSLGARALGLMGGPIGAITAVLGLGLTAWSLWGSSAKDAEDKASAAVERSTASIIADLDNQIQRLERRNALANAKIGGNGFDTASPAADRMGALQIEIDNLRGATTEADLVKRNRLLAEQGQLQLKLNELEQKAAPERAAKALQDHTAAMAKYAPQVDKVTAAIEAERKALGAAFTPEDEAKIKAYFAAHKTGAASVSEAQKQVNAGEKAYGDIMAKDTGYAENFTETVLALVAARDKNNWASEKYNEVIAAYLAMQPGAVAAAKEQAAADAEVAKWQAEAAKSYDEAVASATKNTTSVQEQLEKQLDHNAAIGLGVTAIANLEAAKLSDQATSKERLAALADEIDWSGRLGAQYRQEAIALRELSAAKIAGAQKQAGYDAAQDMAKEQKKAAKESGRYWEDALMRAFESGKGFFESLWDTIKNTLKTQILKVAVSVGMAGLSGIASAVTGGATNSLFGSALGSAATSGMAGSVGSLLMSPGMGSLDIMGLTGGNLWLAAGAGLLAIVSSMAKGETRAGGQYGYSFDGASVTNARRGTSVTATEIGATYLEGPSGGEIAGETTRQIINGTVGGVNALFTSMGSSTRVSGFQAGLESSDRNRGGVFAGGTLSTGATFGESGEGDNYAGTLYDSRYGFNMDSQQAMAAFGTDMKMATIEALQAATDIPNTIADMLDGVDTKTLSDAAATALLTDIEAVTGGVNTVSAAFKTMPFESLKTMSFDATAGLLAAAAGARQVGESMDSYLGRGLQALQTSLSGFYDNFYNDGEKTSNLANNLTSSFKDLGITMPENTASLKGWYRTQVEAAMAADQSVPANQQYLSSLLSLQGGVAQLGDSAETATAGIRNLIDGIHKSATDSIFNMKYGMQDDAGKYRMLNEQLTTTDDKMRGSTDIYQIAELAQRQIDTLDQAWALLSPEQQAAQFATYQDKYNSIDEYVTAMGADAKGVQLEGAHIIADSVTAGIWEIIRVLDPTVVGPTSAVDTTVVGPTAAATPATSSAVAEYERLSALDTATASFTEFLQTMNDFSQLPVEEAAAMLAEQDRLAGSSAQPDVEKRALIESFATVNTSNADKLSESFERSMRKLSEDLSVMIDRANQAQAELAAKMAQIAREPVQVHADIAVTAPAGSEVSISQ